MEIGVDPFGGTMREVFGRHGSAEVLRGFEIAAAISPL
jgi:hypothetical protein